MSDDTLTALFFSPLKSVIRLGELFFAKASAIIIIKKYTAIEGNDH